MTFAFHTGGGINNVDGIAFGDGFGGAFWQTSAARNAIFIDLHCHNGLFLLCEIYLKLNHPFCNVK
jgi:hypothetical protein